MRIDVIGKVTPIPDNKLFRRTNGDNDIIINYCETSNATLVVINTDLITLGVAAITLNQEYEKALQNLNILDEEKENIRQTIRKAVTPDEVDRSQSIKSISC